MISDGRQEGIKTNQSLEHPLNCGGLPWHQRDAGPTLHLRSSDLTKTTRRLLWSSPEILASASTRTHTNTREEHTGFGAAKTEQRFSVVLVEYLKEN